MDKIILNSSCSCCPSDDHILKITSGNDFSIEIQLTIKEGDEWVVYDLSDVDADSLVVNVVSPTGERYEIDAAIANNKVVGVVDANVLEQYVVYGIEVIWRDDPYDKRAYGPKVFKLVDSSLESTSDPFDYDSDSPYEYNLHVNSDIAMLSIGQIPTGDFVTLEMLDEMSYVTQTSLNTTLSDYVQTSALDDYVTQTSLNTTLSDYVQTSALDDYVTQSSLDEMSYVTDTELQDAIAGVTIDESNLVHKTGDENIGGTKTFANRILGQQGMTISHDILAQGAGVSHNLLGQYIRNGIQTGRISSSQIAVSEIIGPHTNSEYTSEERDAIKFCRNTTNNEKDIVLEQMAKIDVNGIYEGTTLLENKYLQIADLPTIPTDTSDLTNGAGFITNSDLTTTLSDYVTNSSLTTTLSDYVTDTDLQTAISGVTIDESNLVHKTGNETIGGIKTFTDESVFNAGNMQYYDSWYEIRKTGSFARISSNQAMIGEIILPRNSTSDNIYNMHNVPNELTFYTTRSPYGNNNYSFVNLDQVAKIDSNGIYEGTTLLSNKYASITDLNSLDGRVTTLENNPSVPSNVVISDDVNEIVCLTQSQYDALSQSQQLDPNTLYDITDAPSNYVTQTSLNTTLSDYVQTSDLSNYVTQTSLNTTLSDYVTDTDLQTAISGLYIPTATSDLTNDSGFITNSDLTTTLSPIESDITSLDGRVTTLENNPSVPSNVVTSDDGNEIICLTQSQYDTLEQNQQLESDVFYYITDATSNYVTTSSLNTTLSDYVTSNDFNTTLGDYVTNTDLQTAISGLSIPTATSDLTNDSGFVSSSSVTTIWKGSQSDYNNISTPDANTLYIIL